VVDDNVDAAVSLAKILSRMYDQEVRVAHDGPSALDAAEEFRPEAVILDIEMPGMDGHEVARRLRGRPELEGVLLIALTGWGQEDDRRRSKEAGFDYHLAKPVESEVLLGLLAAPRAVAPHLSHHQSKISQGEFRAAKKPSENARLASGKPGDSGGCDCSRIVSNASSTIKS
jgi:CheY-like chemotaxis protein